MLHSYAMNKDEILDKAIRRVPDFPKPGILFFDVTSILTNPQAFKHTIDRMVEIYSNKNVDAIAAVESRGFLFGAPLAEKLGIPLVLIRKKGKLPGEIASSTYRTEYSESCLEAQRSAFRPDDRVLLVDDIIATGGSLLAAREVIRQCGAACDHCLALGRIGGLNGEALLREHGMNAVSLLEM